ncbi:MAG: GNAT family N-acetyltransferase [Candidatus Woesearchaeota archaeon]|nr:GNAT family N-acetyltransferase [Candidatus Woesearchaeota archaeon]
MQVDYKTIKSLDLDARQLDSLLDLYDACYGEKSASSPFIKMLVADRNPEPWLWKNLGKNKDKSTIALAMVGEKIVGSTAYIAHDAITNGIRGFILQSNDTMVHPQFRGQGIFQTLFQELNRFNSDKGIDYFYSFPNALNPRVRHPENFSTSIYANVPFVVRSSSVQKLPNEIIQLSSFDGVDSLCQDVEYETGLIKNQEYLAWRYLSNPHNKTNYELIGINDKGSLLGVAVLKMYQEKEMMKGQIVELVSSNPDVTETLITGAESMLHDRGADEISIFMYGNTHHKKVLEQRGYSDRPGSTYLVFGRVNGADTCSLLNSKVYIQMGDNDVF